MPSLYNIAVDRKLITAYMFGTQSSKGLLSPFLVPDLDVDVVSQIFSLDPSDLNRLTPDTTDDGPAPIFEFDPETVDANPRVRGIKFNLTQRMSDVAEDRFPGLFKTMSALAAQNLMRNKEKRIFDALNDTGNFANTAATNPFGTGSTAVSDILDAHGAASDQLGHDINTIVFGETCFKRLVQDSGFQNYVSARLGFPGRTGVVTATEIAAVLNQEYSGEDDLRVYVHKGKYNSAGRGATAVQTPYMTATNTLFGYFPRDLPQLRDTRPVEVAVGSPLQAMEHDGNFVTSPVVCATGPQHGETDSWVGHDPKAQWMRIDYDYDIIVSLPEAAYLLTGC